MKRGAGGTTQEEQKNTKVVAVKYDNGPDDLQILQMEERQTGPSSATSMSGIATPEVELSPGDIDKQLQKRVNELELELSAQFERYRRLERPEANETLLRDTWPRLTLAWIEHEKKAVAARQTRASDEFVESSTMFMRGPLIHFWKIGR